MSIYPRPYAGWHKDIYGGGKESHHLWAQDWLIKWRDEIFFLDGSKIDLKKDVPCIRMHPKDHIKTLSWGPTDKAGQYRQLQAQMLKQGAFVEAFYLEANLILNKRFPSGNNYAREITLAESFLARLHSEGKIKVSEAQLKEIESRQKLRREIDVRELADLRRQVPVLESILGASTARLQSMQWQVDATSTRQVNAIKELQGKITEIKATLERCYGLERQLRYEIGDVRLDRALERLKAFSPDELKAQRQSREVTMESRLREAVKLIKPLTVANHRQAIDEVVVQQRMQVQELKHAQKLQHRAEEAQREQQRQGLQHRMQP
jgi:hypothetical protein